MARTGRSELNYRRTANNRANYIYGNTARDIDVVRRMGEEPRKLSNEARKNREKAHHMSFGYVVFLLAALLVSAMILIHYIQLQSEFTNSTKEIALLESKLNDLKLSNDEEYNRISSNIDLEEIRRIAIGELGMTYAQEGQIITYSNVGADYMRKVADETN
jgi:cell division protein FtsL